MTIFIPTRLVFSTLIWLTFTPTLLFLHDYLYLLLYDYLSIPMWLYFSIPLWLVSCYIFSIPTWLFLNLLHDNLSLIVHDMTIFLYTCIIFSIPSSYSCLFYMTIYSYMTFLYSFMFIPTWLIFDIFLITILLNEIFFSTLSLLSFSIL